MLEANDKINNAFVNAYGITKIPINRSPNKHKNHRANQVTRILSSSIKWFSTPSDTPILIRHPNKVIHLIINSLVVESRVVSATQVHTLSLSTTSLVGPMVVVATMAMEPTTTLEAVESPPYFHTLDHMIRAITICMGIAGITVMEMVATMVTSRHLGLIRILITNEHRSMKQASIE